MGTRKPRIKRKSARHGDTAGAEKTDVLAKGSVSTASETLPVLPTRELHQQIAEAAYLRAEQRGFNGSDPLQDWLEAEKEVLRTYEIP